MSGNEREPLVPKLRFPEFRGAMSALPLDAVADFVSEKTSIDQITPAQYVSTENLLPDFGGISPATKLPSVSSVTSFRHRDILVSNIRPYLKKVWQSDMCGGVSNDVLVIRPTERVGADYLAAILRSNFFIDYVMRGAKGVKMPRGEISMIREFPVPNPCPEEQQKIADCLSSLDELITAETRKLDTLKTHKTGMMQQLFLCEGETVPRLRFPEFREAGEWAECELGSLTTKVGSGITPTGGDKNYKTDGRPFVRSQNIGWGELILDDVAFIDEGTHKSFDSTEIKVSDVLLNITGASIGRSAVADSRIAGGNVNQHVCIIRVKHNELSPTLLNQFLISERGQKQIDSFQAGGNRQGLNFAQIRSFDIPLPPTKNEQRRIADCLSSLNDLITTQSQKIDTLKTHKIGLMQQLFPALDEVPT